MFEDVKDNKNVSADEWKWVYIKYKNLWDVAKAVLRYAFIAKRLISRNKKNISLVVYIGNWRKNKWSQKLIAESKL